MLKQTYRSNIPKLLAYNALSHFMLFFPVWAIFLQRERGLSLLEVTMTDIAFWFTMAVAEIPTGAVADTLGRKASILISAALGIVTATMFATAPTFGLFMLANSLWAIGLTFSSGAGIALFFESLKLSGREGEFTKMRGRWEIARLVSVGLSSALGGLVAEYSLQMTFFIFSGVMVIAFLVMLTVKDTPLEVDAETGKRHSYKKVLTLGYKAIKERPNLRYALYYASFVGLAASMIAVLFIQPHAISIGFSLSLIGFVFLGFLALQTVGAANVERLENGLGEWKLLWVVAAAAVLGVLGIGLFTSWVGVAVFSLTGLAITIGRPTIEKVILRSTPAAARATILSVDSMLSRLAISIIEPGVGLIGESQGLPTAFVGLAVFSFLTLGWLWSIWRGSWQGDLSAETEKGFQ